MKKGRFVAGLFQFVFAAAFAQTEKVPPPPPKPPQPPVVSPNVPPPPPPPAAPFPPPVLEGEAAQLPNDYQDFLNRNPEVRGVHWNKHQIIIRMKNGSEERYERNEKGTTTAEAKYGTLPKAPPPPPKPPKPPVL